MSFDVQSEWMALPEDETARSEVPGWVTFSALLAIIAWAGCFVAGAVLSNWTLLGAALTAPFLVLVIRAVAGRLADVDRDRRVLTLVMGAYAVKLLGAGARYFVDHVIYSGSDASEYHIWGRFLARHYRVFDFSATSGQDVSGTKFLRVVVGIVYTIVPNSIIAGYLVFATIGFVGLLLFWRAFKRAVPTGDHERYAKFVLLLPSLVYWPSGMGKEAWMVVCLGLASYGTAALLTKRAVWGGISLAAGVGGILGVRPHLGFVVLAGVMCAVVLRKNRSGSPFGTWVAIGMLVVMSMAVVGKNKDFFSLDSLSSESVSSQLDATQSRTDTGGSQFKNARGDTPAGFPVAFVTVFYRPFPGEVGSVMGVVTSIECLVMLGVTFASRKSLRRVFKSFRKESYVAYCVGYLLMFVIAFSAFSNFGLLARQRTQALPVFLALLALVPRSERKKSTEPMTITS